MTDTTLALLSELQDIDDREDHILDELLRHGAALEDSERRLNMVTIADLRALRDGLANLEGVIDTLQADVAHAEATASPSLPSAPVNGAASNGHEQPCGGTQTTAQPSAAAVPAAPAAAAPAGATLAAATAPSAPVSAPPVAPAADRTPLPSMSFGQLAALVREQDAETAQIRAILRDRLIALGATPVQSADLAPAAGQGAAIPAPPPVLTLAGPVSGSDLAAHAGAGAATQHRTFRLTSPPMTGGDVKRFQRDLNRRFAGWKINIDVREDGHYGGATRHAARQALLGLGVAPEDYAHGITPQLRSLLRTPSKRTALQLAQAEARRPWRQRLRQREAGTKAARHNGAARSTHDAPAPSHVGGAAAVIDAHGGRYGAIIVHEARAHGLSVALVCAIVENETGFRNVFGHDAVRNSIKSPPKGLLEVTEARYGLYLRERKAGHGCQGVGPMQLTSSGLQDEADAAGGCWKPSANIKVGCKFLAGNIKRMSSTRHGIRAYNGAGPAAERYATHILEREREWQRRLTTAKHTAIAHEPRPHRAAGSAKHAPRTFKLKHPPMSGSDVRHFQRALNARFAHWKIDSHISEDGVYAATTRHAARQVLLGLGIAPGDYEQGITPQLRSKIRNPSRCTPAEHARAKTRTTYLAKLRKRTNASGGAAMRLRAYAEAKRMHDMHIREVGFNRGAKVVEIIRANGGVAGEAWCGDFVAWCYRKADSKSVSRAWASASSVAGHAGVKKTSDPLKGDLLYYTFDHIGMFVSWCDASGNEVDKHRATHVSTIEGNTGSSGALRNDSAGGGDGVYRKVRARGTVAYFMHVSK